MRARGLRVDSIGGRSWTVRRLWVPRLGAETLWSRFRRRFRVMFRRVDNLDGGGCFDVGGLDDLVAILVIVVALGLAVFVVFPLLVALLDVALVLLLTLFGIVSRVVFRRPWTIEALGDDGNRTVWHVVGWRASGALITSIADALRIGAPLPSDGLVQAGGDTTR